MRKKIISILLAVACCFAAFALCGCSGNSGEYTLKVTGDDVQLIAPLKKSYEGGETVTFRTGVICDAEIRAILNGEPLQYTDCYNDDGEACWEFSFVMPNKNSTLHLTTVVMIPSCIVYGNKIAYYDLGYSYDSNTVGFKMNAYVPSLAVWERFKSLIPDFESSYDEKFFERHALLVLFGEKGNGANGTVESVTVLPNGDRLSVLIYADFGSPDDSAPAVMTEWVVVIETDNNLPFSDIEVETNF